MFSPSLFILLKGSTKAPSPHPRPLFPFHNIREKLAPGVKGFNKLEALLPTFIQVRFDATCAVLKMNKSPRDLFISFFPPSAPHHHHIAEGRRRPMKSPKIACFRAATGSRRLDHFFLFVGAASIQLPHKGSGRRGKRTEREQSLWGGWGGGAGAKGWAPGREGGEGKKREKKERKKKKITLVHQFSLIPAATINVSER